MGGRVVSLNDSKSIYRFILMIRQTLLPLLALSASLQAAPVFIGTSTGGNYTSKGIYLADFDAETGKLSQPELAVEYGNPGFLALHPSKPILYASGKPNKPSKDDHGSVAAFAIAVDHGLEFLGEISSGGVNACHVAVDATGNTVAVANYGDGSFSTIRLDEAGVPTAAASVIKSKGAGSKNPRQSGPHAHGVYFNKASTLLFMPDLGLNSVLVYPFDATTSKLGDALPAVVTAAEAGPRHMAFSPDEKHGYVLNELDNTVTAYAHVDGKFTALGSLPTLPEDFTGNSTTAEIEVHSNGKFVYCSNRGHDSIAVYQRDPATGELTYLQHAPCGGKTPRHFKIDPTGKWLLCAHQNSNTISVLALDPATGLLGGPENTIFTPSPICLVFDR